MAGTASRALQCALWVGAASLGWIAPVRAQQLVDAEQTIEEVADSAGEASSVSSQIEATAYSESGDQEALQSFRLLADWASLTFEQIYDQSVQGKGLAETRPLFDKAIQLSHLAMRVGQSGGIAIDPVLVEEFTTRIDELGEKYRATPTAAADETSSQD